MYDRLDKADLVFAHLSKGNTLVDGLEKKTGRELPSYLPYVQRMQAYLTPDLARAAETSALEAKGDSPIFLMGFMRSGTTLLEQVLDSHPKLQSIEVRPNVEVLVKAFEDMTRGRTNALAELTEAEVVELRGVYFRELARHVELQPGKRLVDKMPLSTTNSHLIWRIFPQSKFILAIRHPCDVCLSSFMQNFEVNQATAHFLYLEEGVKIYAAVMQLWQQTARMVPLDYHRVRYEDLIADFEGETRALLDFLKLEWRHEVLDYANHALKRGTVSTASYHQVTQPIYQHANIPLETLRKADGAGVTDIATFHRIFRLRRITSDLMNKLNQAKRYLYFHCPAGPDRIRQFQKNHNNEHVNHAT